MTSVTAGHAGGTWGLCPECRRPRRLTDRNVMRLHSKWDGAARGMVRCEGSGQRPTPAAATCVVCGDPIPYSGNEQQGREYCSASCRGRGRRDALKAMG